MRTIVFAKFSANATPILKEIRLLTIHYINKIQTACFDYKAINKLLHPCFSALYVTNSDNNSHNTRQTFKLDLFRHCLNIRKHSNYVTHIIWKSLTSYLTERKSLMF